jgi:hypothetical protein
VKIHHQIEALMSKMSRECEILREPGPAGGRLDHQDVIQMRIVRHDRRGVAFHHVGDLGVGKGLADGADGWRGENHIADQAESDQKNFQAQADKRTNTSL